MKIGPSQITNRGLIATEGWEAGDPLLSFLDKATGPFTNEELTDGVGARRFRRRLSERDVDNALQVGPDAYLVLGSHAVQANHSCVPNTGLNTRLQLIALRDIAPGEEITWDYSTSMDDGWCMLCNCGEDLCRGIIEDFKLIPREVAERYAGLGVVLPHVIHHLKEH